MLSSHQEVLYGAMADANIGCIWFIFQCNLTPLLIIFLTLADVFCDRAQAQAILNQQVKLNALVM